MGQRFDGQGSEGVTFAPLPAGRQRNLYARA
jgi:hypothetical protein